MASKSETALDQVVRGLELQERSLESLRGRSALAATTAMVVAGFAAQATAGRSPLWWLGVAAAGGVVVCATGAAWPAELAATFDGYDLVRDYVDDEHLDAESMRRDLALYGEAFRRENEHLVRRRSGWYLVAVGFLVGESVALLLSAHI